MTQRLSTNEYAPQAQFEGHTECFLLDQKQIEKLTTTIQAKIQG